MFDSFETSRTSIPASSIICLVLFNRSRYSDRSNGSFTLLPPFPTLPNNHCQVDRTSRGALTNEIVCSPFTGLPKEAVVQYWPRGEVGATSTSLPLRLALKHETTFSETHPEGRS